MAAGIKNLGSYRENDKVPPNRVGRIAINVVQVRQRDGNGRCGFRIGEASLYCFCRIAARYLLTVTMICFPCGFRADILPSELIRYITELTDENVVNEA